jgi:hypothetical protein
MVFLLGHNYSQEHTNSCGGRALGFYENQVWFFESVLLDESVAHHQLQLKWHGRDS